MDETTTTATATPATIGTTYLMSRLEDIVHTAEINNERVTARLVQNLRAEIQATTRPVREDTVEFDVKLVTAYEAERDGEQLFVFLVNGMLIDAYILDGADEFRFTRSGDRVPSYLSKPILEWFVDNV